MTILAAGEIIDSYCTKCKLKLNHTIVALVNGEIGKVTCNTCGGTHKYRGVDGSGSKTTRAKVAKSKTTKTDKVELTIAKNKALWEKELAVAKGESLPYDMGNAYIVGNVVAHSVFGKGIVRKIANKACYVLFEDKERLLAMSC